MFRVTLRDIAKRAGVSHATVSRALKNSSELSIATCRGIQELAKEMGYQPDPVLAALMSYRQTRKTARFQSTIGIISDSPQPSAWRQGFKSEMANAFFGMKEHATELGYVIEEISPAHMKVKDEQLSQILKNRGIRGIIVAPRTPSRGSLKMDWSPFSAITIGYSLNDPYLHRVSRDHLSDIITVMRRLAKLGYRRVGFVLPQDLDERTEHRHWAGYSIESRKTASKNRIPWFVDSIKEEDNLDKFSSWLKKYKPDVVVAISNHILWWLSLLNFEVPKEIGFVGLNTGHFVQEFRGRNVIATGISSGYKIIGVTALDLLVGMLHRNECGIPRYPQTILINGDWIDGETVRPQITKI